MASLQIADCTRAVASLLLPFDHHTVSIRGREGVLLTHHWLGTRLEEPLFVQVAFIEPAGHLRAPLAIQAAIDRLVFRPWDGCAPSLSRLSAAAQRQ